MTAKKTSLAARRAAWEQRTRDAQTLATVAILPAALPLPCIISHVTFLGIRQLKRVDSVQIDGVECDPRVRASLNVADESRPLARLKGDTVAADGSLVGEIRGWQTYVYADEALDVIA